MAEIDTQLINTQHSWDMCATCAQHFKTQCSDYYDKFGDKRPDAETAHAYFFSKPEYKCGCFEDDQQIMGFLVTSGRRGFLLRIAQNNHTCITGTYYMYDQPTDQILYKKTIRESTIIMPMSVLRKILIEFEIEHQTKKLSAASATSTPNICKKCIRHFNSFNTIKTHCLDNNFMYKTPKVHLHGKIVYTITFAKIPPIGDTTSMFVPLHTYIITNSEITHYNMHSTTIDNANHDANHDAIFNILTERCKSDKY